MSKTTNNKDLKLPERWLACPQRSKIIADKFVVFKAPLDSKFDSQTGANKFTLDTLKSSLQEEKLSLKLVIDLSKSSRFYDPAQLTSSGIQYVKIACIGRDEAPNEEAKNTFMETVRSFEGLEGDVIGVHCTHGFNRSGFMIISYLVEELDFGLDAAIMMFKNLRYPGIYKEGYIARLCEVYDAERDDVPPIPSNLPSWVTDVESNQRPDVYKTAKVFMDGAVRGVETVTELEVVLEVQNDIKRLCGFTMSGFPGGQPVSMSKENIENLRKMPYMVSWKADGTRFMMYIQNEVDVYMVDRDNTVYKPHHLNFPWKQQHLYNTLLDGELVMNVERGVTIPTFLVYDIVSLQGERVGDKAFNERQEAIRAVMEERSRRVVTAREPFKIRLKEFWKLDLTVKLLADKFKRNLPHEMDGLIFQPASKPYLAGKCEEILKWKPPGLNSVDVLVRIKTEQKPGCPKETFIDFCCDDQAITRIPYKACWKHLEGKIVESHWDGKSWTFMRIRTDKSYPNSYATYMSVWETIKNPVTEEHLLGTIASLGTNHLSMPPTTSKRPSQEHDTHQAKKIKL